jgi:hypothetical protein
MPRVEFAPTIPTFEWTKTVHVFDRVATLITPATFTLNNLHEYSAFL